MKPSNRRNELSGEDIEDLLRRLKEIANNQLGLTNYIHLDDINLADDGTFTVSMSKGVREKPAGAPTKSKILNKYEGIEEFGSWEKRLFWSWDDRYMELSCKTSVRFENGSTETLIFGLNEKAADMKEWKGSYISLTDSRSTVMETSDGETVDTYFGKKPKERKQKQQEDMEDANKDDLQKFPSDEVSRYMNIIYDIWHHGRDGRQPLKTHFNNPRDEPFYDIKQNIETKRLRYQTRRMSEILNDLSNTRDSSSLPNSFESAEIQNRISDYQELYAAYNCLDNEVRPNPRFEQFTEEWNKFTRTFRSLHSRMKEL